MAKGKKFDAAEKHFQKLKEKYERHLKTLYEQKCSLQDELVQAKNRIHELESENTQQCEWIERLLKYTELSKEDIAKACQIDIDKNNSKKMINNILSFITPYM
jgi:hypothetical protein